MKTTIKRRQGSQTPRWKVFGDGVLLGYAETEDQAESLASAHRDREALRWAMAAGAGFVSWDVAAANSGWRATWAYKEHIQKLMPRELQALGASTNG